MIANKKGLSDVVTTVLIILLVLAAVAIIATYVINSVQKGGEQIGGAATCTALQLEPVSCTYTASGADWNLKVMASKKGVDASVSKLEVIGEKSDRTTEKLTADSTPGYLLTATVYEGTGVVTANKYKKVSLVSTITTDAGDTVTCGETRKIDCIG